jgi:hypothetical protein
MSIIDKIKFYGSEIQKNNLILEKQGTWLHKAAYVVHLIAKLTSFVPTLKSKMYPFKVSLESSLKKQLEQKFEKYKELIKKHQDQHGFIATDRCDSLLYSSLLSCVIDNIDICAARDAEGWWHRRPLSHPQCFPFESKSSISRDMIVGLVWYLYHNKNLKVAEETLQLYKKHNYVMGQGDPARIVLMPGLESTLAEIIYRLGGRDRWITRHQLQVWSKNLTDYEVHLLILHALLQGELLGSLKSNIVEVFKAYAERNPCNPLHQFAYRLYTDGNMNDVVTILLDESLWPADRLPKRKDRSSSWLNAHDCDDNYLPTEEDADREHSGGDFLFVAWLILKALNKES